MAESSSHTTAAAVRRLLGCWSLLMIPWLAMQLDVDGVVWSTGDYVAATALLTLLWGLIEAVLHLALQGAARMLAFACAVLVVAGIWAGLAVG